MTRIPRGKSSCARVEVACPIADLEYMYGKDDPEVAGSLVHPFMLLVMIICGGNFLPLTAVYPISFHLSKSGRKANVSQYGPTAFVCITLSKTSSCRLVK